MELGTFFKYWRNQRQVFGDYWATYGRFGSLIRSPYLHVAIILTVLCGIFVDLAKVSISDLAISVIPNLLGFTIGAMAIALAFSSAQIFRIVAEEGEPDSFFMKLMANLLHFIISQVLTLISAIVGKAIASPMFQYLTLGLLLYAILVALAAGIQLFQAASVYNSAAGLPTSNDAPASEASSIGQ